MTLRFADIEIDDVRRELRRGGSIVHVEPQVFDLLVHLVRNNDRAVGREELVDVIWQRRTISGGTLNRRIAAARRAIGNNGDEQRLILHGHGLRFIGVLETEAIETGLKQSSAG